MKKVKGLCLLVVWFFVEFTWLFPSLFNSKSDFLVMGSFINLIAAVYIAKIILKKYFTDEEK